MSGPGFAYLLARARALPPHVVAYRALRLTWRSGRRQALAWRDRLCTTFVSKPGEHLNWPLDFDLGVIDPPGVDALRVLTAHYLAHEFDLLGSGWVRVSHGAAMAGFDGNVYTAPALRDRDPTVRLNRANRTRARAIYTLIDDPAYTAIDWQRDLRSGYRWSEAALSRRVAIGSHAGADIKQPWELSRLQHLPQLALAARLASVGTPGFAPAARYLAEIRNQLLDFLACNPPRYGANWVCPMDVGIRVANIAVAHGLLRGAGFAFDAPCEAVLAAAVVAHAEFVITHLEWAEQGRSNHYLSDVVGLLFAALVLPAHPRAAYWARYAAGAVVHDTGVQFLPDGGNYEGSTSYHCLSAELVALGLAAVAALLERSDLPLAPPRAVAGVPGAADAPADLHAALRALAPRLARMLAFTRAIRRPDGRIVQIGDTDSGRLFKLVPLLEPAVASAPDAARAQGQREASLLPDDAIAALAVLCGESPQRGRPMAELVRAIGGAGCCAAVPLAALPLPGGGAEPLEHVARVEAEGISWVTQVFAVPGLEPAALDLQVFPEFGLYVWRGPGLFLTVRCGVISDAAPSAHFHDDNLALELHIDGVATISDPGTYVYTASPGARNAYRAAAAHFAPRAREWAAVEFTDYLFELLPRSRATCLHVSAAGIVARLEHAAGIVERVVGLDHDGITVFDRCAPGELAPAGVAIRYCAGYGRQTPRPAVAI